MKVLVTGGGGYLGQAIVRQLLEKGFEVATYSRDRYDVLEKPGIVQHQGSLTGFEALKRAMQGCEAVFHAAAKTGTWGSHASFYEANVAGTEHVLKACLALGIPHLIFTSTASVVYDGGSGGKDERLPYPRKFDASYPLTKALAEQAVLKANGPSMVTCALRPHLVWGPGDPHFLPRIYERRRRGQLRLPGAGEYLVDTTYVDNAARAHLQAFDAMRKNPASVAGKAYFLSQGEPVTIRDFMNRLLAAGGLPPVDKTIDPRVALAAGWLLERVFRLLGSAKEPPITLFLAKQLSSSHWYDISAARRDFGYVPEIPMEEGMRRLKEWIADGV